jgi:16S rRNA G966 N2-methylase RsmD
MIAHGSDSPSVEDDAPVRLDQQALLHRLAALMGVPNIEALRAEIVALRREVRDPGGALWAQHEAHAVEYAAWYLDGELAQIGAAQGLERAIYYIGRLARSAEGPRTSAINDLDLNRWKSYSDLITDSLWIIERRDTSGVHSAGYWGNFVPQIPNQLLRRYTRRGDWVIDPFTGSGTTLIEAQRLGRNALGVELQPHMVEHARSLLAAEPNRWQSSSLLETGDSLSADYAALLGRAGVRQAQLVILHPPYHDIIRFSDDPRDLSNTSSTAEFLQRLGDLVDRLLPVLERGRYLALVIGDKYARGEWHPLGFQAMQTLLERKLLLKSIVVKNFESTAGKRSQQELWRYRALAGGFYVFKHEYMFVFRKK